MCQTPSHVVVVILFVFCYSQQLSLLHFTTSLWFQNSSGCSHKTLQPMSVVVIAAACLGSKPAGYEVLCLLCKRVMQDAATLRAQCQR